MELAKAIRNAHNLIVLLSVTILMMAIRSGDALPLADALAHLRRLQSVDWIEYESRVLGSVDLDACVPSGDIAAWLALNPPASYDVSVLANDVVREPIIACNRLSRDATLQEISAWMELDPDLFAVAPRDPDAPPAEAWRNLSAAGDGIPLPSAGSPRPQRVAKHVKYSSPHAVRIATVDHRGRRAWVQVIPMRQVEAPCRLTIELPRSVEHDAETLVAHVPSSGNRVRTRATHAREWLFERLETARSAHEERLRPVWGEVKDLTLARAIEVLDSRLRATAQDFSFLGIRVHESGFFYGALAFVWGLALHISTLMGEFAKRRPELVEPTPWIGSIDGTVPSWITTATVLILPNGSLLIAAWQTDQGFIGLALAWFTFCWTAVLVGEALGKVAAANRAAASAAASAVSSATASATADEDDVGAAGAAPEASDGDAEPDDGSGD